MGSGRSVIDVTEVRPDLARMRRERRARLQAEMQSHNIGAMFLTGTSAMQYAVGDVRPVADASHVLHEQCTALVLAGDDLPHLFTPFPEHCPAELAGDHCHPPLCTVTPAGVAAVAATIRDLAGGAPSGSLALDEAAAALHFGLSRAFADVGLVDAAEALGAARVLKTADEIECIQRAQRINEDAMYEVQRALRPGVRQSELTGIFLRRIFELGATGNCVDPIWQPMPAWQELGPYTTNGNVAFPLCSNDRFLAEGDLIWTDTGIDYHGYASDFGTTWIVDRKPDPSPRQRDQFERWKEVVRATLAVTRPGVTAADLTKAAIEANGGTRPWLDHFYLAHGIGTFSAEMPLIGSDLGPAFDETLVLAAGMVMVLEPVIWDDGDAGYRYEEVVVVTEDGYRSLSTNRYFPYE